jgi:hypothetical protein
MTVHEETHTPDHIHTPDAELADEIRGHHAGMVAALGSLTGRLEAADGDEKAHAREALDAWFRDVLVPHADEEEVTTYRAAAELTEGRLLIEAMLREHVLIKRLVGYFESADDLAVAAAFARAAYEAFDSHQGKENDVILPLLVDSPSVALAEVMGQAHGHHQVGEHHHPGHEHHGH